VGTIKSIQEEEWFL